MRSVCFMMSIAAVVSLAGCAHLKDEPARLSTAPPPCQAEAATPVATDVPLVRFKLRDGTVANLYASRPHGCDQKRL